MLTNPQKESEPMKDLKYDLKLENGILIYTASTMQEQRDIAKYINSIDGGDYEIWDFSQKEQHPSNKPLNTDHSKLIITNMQEIGLAPYAKSDDKTTITVQHKIDWFNSKMNTIRDKNEAKSLQMINMTRDNWFHGKKVICGMHPNFLEKMESLPYYAYIDDWLDYAVDKIKFNEDPEFVPSLSLNNSHNNMGVQVHDMIFAFQDKVVRWPNFDAFAQYTDTEYNEKLPQLPEVSFSSRKIDGREKDL